MIEECRGCEHWVQDPRRHASPNGDCRLPGMVEVFVTVYNHTCTGWGPKR